MPSKSAERVAVMSSPQLTETISISSNWSSAIFFLSTIFPLKFILNKKVMQSIEGSSVFWASNFQRKTLIKQQVRVLSQDGGLQNAK